MAAVGEAGAIRCPLGHRGLGVRTVWRQRVEAYDTQSHRFSQAEVSTAAK